MIAYRAETALVAIVREVLVRSDDPRALVCDLFRSEADILPDLKQRVLHVRVHPMANPHANRTIAHLIGYLNDAQYQSQAHLRHPEADPRPHPKPLARPIANSGRSGVLILFAYAA